MNLNEMESALRLIVKGTNICSFGILQPSHIDVFLKAACPKLYIFYVNKHWIVLYADNFTTSESFDSLGRSLLYYSSNFKLISSPLENCIQLQHGSSSVCGQWVLM